MAKITSLGLGKQIEVAIEDTEGQSLPDVMQDLEISISGQAVFVNGSRLTEGEAERATIKDGDHVELQPKAEGGV